MVTVGTDFTVAICNLSVITVKVIQSNLHAVQCIVLQCSVMQCSAVYCRVIQCGDV